MVIPCHLAKSLQATTSSFIFILMLKSLELDSNWNIMQQVRSHTKYYVSRTRKRTRKFFLSYKCQLIFIGMKIFFFKYKTIVSISALSFAHSDPDPNLSSVQWFLLVALYSNLNPVAVST